MALLVCLRNRHQDQSVSGNRHHISPYPSLDRKPHTWKKGISDSFQTQILPKILPLVGIFSFTIMVYLKKLIGIKYLNTKQCSAGFSSRITPSPPVSSQVYPPRCILPGVSPLLPKDRKIKLDLPHFIKGMGVRVLFFSRANFPPKKGEVIMRE